MERGTAKPAEAMNVEQKTRLLLRERRIVVHLEMLAVSPATGETLTGHLESLQRRIYQLDEYGEANWQVAPPALRNIWDLIEREVKSFGCGQEAVAALLQEVRTYQEVELGMRSGVSPSHVGISAFYRLKSCDVRLARELIRRAARHEDTVLRLAWDLHDIAGEVCDDLEDIAEDADTFNANRFRLAWAESGFAATVAEYCGFVDGLAARARLMAKSCPGPTFVEILADWTEARARAARSMIHRIHGGSQPGTDEQLPAKQPSWLGNRLSPLDPPLMRSLQLPTRSGPTTGGFPSALCPTLTRPSPCSHRPLIRKGVRRPHEAP
jgi:hypothetical protein